MLLIGLQLTKHAPSLSSPLARQVSTEETQYIRTVDNLIASRLSLKLQLQAVHFVAASHGTAHANSHSRSAGNVQQQQMQANANANANPNPNALPVAKGGLLLRCTAQIGDLYQEYKEIELGTPQKDPVPARGKR